jgi:hypothetical protein
VQHNRKRKSLGSDGDPKRSKSGEATPPAPVTRGHDRVTGSAGPFTDGERRRPVTAEVCEPFPGAKSPPRGRRRPY